jgi:uncharacterized protein
MSAAFKTSRKPLAAHFKLKGTGASYFVCNVHFGSKGGSDPLFGPKQPPANGGEAKRTQQATVVRNFAEGLLCADPAAAVVVLGDMNEFTENPPLQVRCAIAAASVIAVRLCLQSPCTRHPSVARRVS